MTNDLNICHDIPGIMKQVDLSHERTECRIFIRNQVKKVVLFNGNEQLSFSVVYEILLKWRSGILENEPQTS